MTECTLDAVDIRANAPGHVLVRCGEPAIAVITFACIHEHVHTQPACTGCTVEVQQVEDILICPDCEDGPDSHECKAVIRIRWEES